MNTPGYRKFVAQRKPTNPIFLALFKKMHKNGDLKGLDDDVALEKVVTATEQLISSQK